MYPATKMLIVMLVLFFACVILAAIFGERFWAPVVWAFGAVVFTAYRFMVRKRTTLPSAKTTISWTVSAEWVAVRPILAAICGIAA